MSGGKYIPPHLRSANGSTMPPPPPPPHEMPLVNVSIPDHNNHAAESVGRRQSQQGGTRCAGCYIPNRQHKCPSSYPPKDCREVVFDWKFGKTTDKIYTVLATHRLANEINPLSPADMLAGRYEFFLTADNAELYREDGTTYKPPKSWNFTTVSVLNKLVQLEPSVVFVEMLRKKAEINVVNGHSTHTSSVADMTTALLRECQLKWYLRQTGHQLVDLVDYLDEPYQMPISTRGPAVTIRLAKSLLDFHNLDNSSLFLFGEHIAMQELAKEITSQLTSATQRSADMATGIIALPLSSLLFQDEKEILSELRDTALAILPNKLESNKFCLDSHFVLNLVPCVKPQGKWMNDDFLPEEQQFMPWRHTAQGLLPMDQVSVLVAVWNYPDIVKFGTTGGKRTLGETSLDCAIRETREEIQLDLQDAYVRKVGAEDASQLPAGEGPWYLCMRLQHSVNNFVYLHESMISRL